MKKSITNYEKHVIKCPSCGKDVLDHMAICPYCQGKLQVGYSELSKKTKKTVKIVLWIILGALSVTLIILKVLDIF